MTTSTLQPSSTRERALARGVADGLKVYRVSGHYELRFVTAKSDDGLGYLVTLLGPERATCSCTAAKHNRLCKHIALVLADQAAADAAHEAARAEQREQARRAMHPVRTPEELADLQERGRLANLALFGPE